MAQEITLPDDGTQLAVTENGTRLDKYTENDVNLTLRLLILSGGSIPKTIEALADEGIVVSHQAIRYWRDNAFSSRFYELRRALAQEVGEEIAGRALERAVQYDDAEAEYIRAAVEKIEDVSPDKLAKAASDLARAKAVNVEKAQLLRNRPTEIREVRDTAEILAALAREGLIERDERIADQGEIIEGVVLDPDELDDEDDERENETAS